MKITILRNPGNPVLRQLKQLGADEAELTEGRTVTVKEAVGTFLCDRRLAIVVESAKPEPQPEIRAVPANDLETSGTRAKK